jgi:hypothetical protein
MMLIDEQDDDAPTDPWWMVWGDAIAFCIACVSLTIIGLSIIWSV